MQWMSCKGLGELPSALVKDHRPSNACLCRRAECLYVFLGNHERSQARVHCVFCGKSNLAQGTQRRHRVEDRGEERVKDRGQEGGAALRTGRAAMPASTTPSQERTYYLDVPCATQQHNHTTDAVVSDLPVQKALARVRSKLEGIVGRGEIGLWEHAVRWSELESERDGDKTTGTKRSGEENVQRDRRNSREQLTCSRYRNRAFHRWRRPPAVVLPLPKQTSGRSRWRLRPSGSRCGSGRTITLDASRRRVYLQAVLDRVIFNEEDGGARMGVARAAGRNCPGRSEVARKSQARTAPGGQAQLC